MLQNKELARSISDASISRLVDMLIYKAKWYGKRVIKVPNYFPSSQLCSSCGYRNAVIKDLHIRKWTCPYCGTIHDRDINAAKNILRKGIQMLTKGGTHPDSLLNLES